MWKSLALAALLLVGCSKTTNDGAYDASVVYLSGPEREFVATHVIKIGMSPAHPPFVVTDGEGGVDGISDDFLKEITKKTGLKFQVIIFNTLPEGLNMMKSGKVDMLSDLATTPDRLKVMNFSEPYVSVGSTMLLHGLPVTFPLTVAYANTYAVEAYMKKISGQVSLVPAVNDEEAFEKLVFNQVGAAVMNYATADFFETKYNKKYARSFVDFTYDYSFAYQKDNGTLGLILNKAISNISEAERTKIRSRWMSKASLDSAKRN